jgi:thiamine biosynthesis lipoprotein
VRRVGAPVALDLGGIAKGFAIDLASDALREAGCLSALVNAGGDVRVFGPAPHAIELRVGGVAVDQIPLINEAVAVSEPRTSRSPSGHRGFYSPVTAQQVPARAVAVCAPTASVADALTKCAILCSPGVLRSLLSEYGARVIELETLLNR